MTQSDMVLRHMQIYGSISAKEAMEEYGIMRLGARIYDLKKLGYPIIKHEVCAKNRFGDPVHFARYELAETSSVEGERESV